MGEARTIRFGLLLAVQFITLTLFIPRLAEGATGLDYLASQQAADGSFLTTATSLATPVQSTSESLRAYLSLGQTTQPGFIAALSYLNSSTEADTETLAAKIIVNPNDYAGSAAWRADLIARQNADGGFGAYALYASASLDTAFAAEALSTNGQESYQLVRAIGYLIANQRSDGSFAGTDQYSSVYVTSVAFRALWANRNISSAIPTTLSKAANYLLSQRSGALWPETFDSALALIALSAYVSDTASLADAASFLKNAVLADGSWAGDVFTTALALRAINAFDTRLATKPEPNPVPDPTPPPTASAGIAGYVATSGSAEPVVGASVSISELPTFSVKTDERGYFLLSGLGVGTYTVVARQSGYGTVSTIAEVRNRQITLANTLYLSLIAGVAIVQGTVLDSDVGVGLSNTHIRLVGNSSYTATSDGNGRYYVSAVTPGTYTVYFEHTNFNTVSTNITVAQDQVLNLSVSMTRSGFAEEGVGEVLGVVLDGGTGLPIANAAVDLGNGANATTDAKGRFFFPSLARGTYTGTVSADGYRGNSFTFVFCSVCAGNAGVIKLYSVTSSNAPTSLTLIGTVLNTSTLGVVPGASVVAVSAGTTVTATAGSDGSFSIQLPNTSMQVTIRATGYQPVLYTMTAPGFGELKATFLLTPSTYQWVQTRSNYAASGVVVDSVTGLPLAASITGNCGGKYIRASTNAAGLFVIPDLPEVCDLTFSGPTIAYMNKTIRATFAPFTITDLGTITLQRANSSSADLVVKIVDRGSVSTDPQTLSLAGDIQVEIRNQGYTDVSQHPFTVLAFHDLNHNGQFDEGIDLELGRANATDPVLANKSVVVPVPAQGKSEFRDAPIYVWVDADKTIYELDETNNIGSYTSNCVAPSTAPINVPPGHTAEIFATSVTNEQGPTQLAFDSKDNLYIAAGSGSTILKIPTGTTTPHPFGFGHSDPDGVAIDSQDNVIVSDNYVKKYNSEGTLIWQNRFCFSNPQGAAVDAEGNAYIGSIGGGTCKYHADGTADTAFNRYSGGDFPAIGPDNLFYAGIYGSGTAITKSTLDGVRLDVLAIYQGGGALAFASNGDLYFGTSGSFVSKMTFPNKIVSRFASGFSAVQAIAFDSKGAFYAGDHVTKTIYKITDTRKADLTSSLLKLVDNGAGLPASLTVRIGNGGAEPSPDGVVVSFYQGHPAAGGALLGSETLPPLAINEYRDLRLDNVILSGNADIFVVADSDNKVSECNEANNVLSIKVPSATLGLISVSTDKTTYGPNENMSLGATITNSAGLAGDYTVEFVIEDTLGGVVTSFAPIDVTGLPSTSSATVGQSFNTGTTLVGTYVLRGILRNSEGTILHAAQSRFTIGSVEGAPTLLLRLSTDRASYHTTDLVNISLLAGNNTANTIIDNTMVRITVTNSTGGVVFTQDSNLAQLPPGGLRDLLLPYYLDAAATGTYTITATVMNKTTQAVLGIAAAQYLVASDLNKSLAASIQPALASLDIGTPQVCTTTLTNKGSIAVSGLEIHESIVNIDTQTLAGEAQSELTLAGGQTKTSPRTFATTGHHDGNYACVIQALINGNLKTLAYAPFKLTLPPIRIDGELKVGSRGRVLVLIDTINRCEPGNSQSTQASNASTSAACARDEDPHGPKGAPKLSAQREFQEGLLKNEGWSYTITDSAKAFTDAFHSAAYSTYALLSEQEKLDELTHKELREAVFRGDGLLVAGPHDGRNQHYEELNDALGIKPIGSVADAARLEIPNNSLELPGTLSLYQDDKAIRVKRSMAQSLGTYGINGTPVPDPEDCHDPSDSNQTVANCYSYLDGLTETTYGEGKSLFAGFDLLAVAARDGATSDAAMLLKKALVHVASTPKAQVGGALPLDVILTNKGMSTEAKVTVTLPPGVSVIDAKGAQVTSTQNPGEIAVTWTTSLDLNEEEKKALYLRLPKDAGQIQIKASVEAPVGGSYQPFASPSLTLTVPEVTTLEPINTTLTTLISTKSGYAKALKQAQSDLDKAIKAKSAEDAITYAIKATDALIGISDQDIVAVRVDIDRWVRLKRL